jgi:hypothetical protein
MTTAHTSIDITPGCIKSRLTIAPLFCNRDTNGEVDAILCARDSDYSWQNGARITFDTKNRSAAARSNIVGVSVVAADLLLAGRSNLEFNYNPTSLRTEN